MPNVDEERMDVNEQVEDTSDLDENEVDIEEEVDDQEGIEEESDGEEPQRSVGENQAEALRQARNEIAQLKSQNNFLQGLAYKEQPQQQSQQKRYIDELDDDEPITKKDIARINDESQAELRQSQRAREIDMQEEIVRSNNADYEQVKAFFFQLASQDQSLMKDVADSSNPAMRIYQVGKSHPDYINEMTKRATSDVTRRVKSNVEKVKPSFTRAKKSKPDPNKKDWDNASEEDVEAKLQEVLNRQV